MRTDEYPTAYGTFRSAVEMLGLDPLDQCQAMGNYNVAWELKDDVSAGSFILASPNCSLNAAQRKVVEELIEVLKKIPDDLLREAKSEADNLEAMNHPAWMPIRAKAAQAFELLPEPEF